MICRIEADGYWEISHDIYRREMDMKACEREDAMREHIKELEDEVDQLKKMIK